MAYTIRKLRVKPSSYRALIRLMALTALPAVAFAGIAGCTSSSSGGGGEQNGPDNGHHHDHVAGALRALLSDENGVLRLYNLSDGDVVWTHTFADANAADLSGLTTTEDGRFGVINLRGTANRVNFLDSGVLVEEHGDHVHLEVEPPQLLDYEISGDQFGASRIAHIVSRDGRVSAFFDGEPGLTDSAYAITFPLTNLTAASPVAADVLIGNRHHGVSLPAEHDAVIMSVAESGVAGSTARTGVRVFEGTTEVAGFPNSCSGLHGYAVIGDHYLFGCANAQGGVLVLTHDHDAATEWSEHQVDFPEGATNGISNFAAHPALGFALAPWGTDAFIRVHPDAGQMSEDDLLELPAPQCGYTLREDSGEHLLVLTVDGVLRAYDADDWSEGPQLAVLNGFECSGTVPLLRSVGSYVYVTDPAGGALLEIEIEDNEFEIHGSISVQGEPRRLALFRHPAGHEDHDH